MCKLTNQVLAESYYFFLVSTLVYFGRLALLEGGVLFLFALALSSFAEPMREMTPDTVINNPKRIRKSAPSASTATPEPKNDPQTPPAITAITSLAFIALRLYRSISEAPAQNIKKIRLTVWASS